MTRVDSRSEGVGIARSARIAFGFVKHQIEVVTALADLFPHRRRSPAPAVQQSRLLRFRSNSRVDPSPVNAIGTDDAA
jgi:hypothetical protein